VDAREERLARNEVLFREINQRIADVAEPHARPPDGHNYEFFCECSNIDCDLRVPLTFGAYEHVRSDPRQFIVASGHSLPDIEDVVFRTNAYEVVVKHGEAARLAEENDPSS
jgi:hypothetical protein